MEKSPEAFRTIREVADTMDLPQHVLRFWETRFPQIRPLKRAGGRRYYRPDDVERLRIIKRLLYDEGYTIKGVQKLFREQGVHALTSGALEAKERSSDSGPVESTPALEQPLLTTPRFSLAPDAEPPLSGEVGAHSPGPAQRASEREIVELRAALADLREAERILSQARAGAVSASQG